MKKARFILTALILLAGVGGVFAFKVSRFTANPVQLSTDFVTIKIGGATYAAYAGFNGAPALLCQSVAGVFWNPFGAGVTLNAWTTLPLITTVPFTAFTTTTVGGPTVTVTLIRSIFTCVQTVGIASITV